MDPALNSTRNIVFWNRRKVGVWKLFYNLEFTSAKVSERKTADELFVVVRVATMIFHHDNYHLQLYNGQFSSPFLSARPPSPQSIMIYLIKTMMAGSNEYLADYLDDGEYGHYYHLSRHYFQIPDHHLDFLHYLHGRYTR